MSNEEALTLLHGDITTIRDGELTHQCIQTNLNDVINGGSEFDKVLYARQNKHLQQSASFPVQPNFERRHSFRLFSNHAKKLKRSESTCTISKKSTSRTSTIDDFSTLSSSCRHSDLPIDKSNSNESFLLKNSDLEIKSFVPLDLCLPLRVISQIRKFTISGKTFRTLLINCL